MTHNRRWRMKTDINILLECSSTPVLLIHIHQIMCWYPRSFLTTLTAHYLNVWMSQLQRKVANTMRLKELTVLVSIPTSCCNEHVMARQYNVMSLLGQLKHNTPYNDTMYLLSSHGHLSFIQFTTFAYLFAQVFNHKSQQCIPWWCYLCHQNRSVGQSYHTLIRLTVLKTLLVCLRPNAVGRSACVFETTLPPQLLDYILLSEPGTVPPYTLLLVLVNDFFNGYQSNIS